MRCSSSRLKSGPSTPSSSCIERRRAARPSPCGREKVLGDRAGRLREAALLGQFGVEFIGRERLRIEETLQFVAAERLEKAGLLGCFYSFGRDRQAERARAIHLRRSKAC